MVEFLNDVLYALSHPNLSFFVGVALSYFSVAIAEFGIYLMENIRNLRKKGGDTE